jgi:hypothetical protein
VAAYTAKVLIPINLVGADALLFFPFIGVNHDRFILNGAKTASLIIMDLSLKLSMPSKDD